MVAPKATFDVGIDVGTTFTAAAIARDGAVEPVALTTSRVTVPSVVFAAGDELLFGGAAERRGAASPNGLAREFKRRVGDPVPLMLSGSPYHADRLTALMANWVLGTVAEQFGGSARGVVFTHPAAWTEYQLGTLRNALGDVGLGYAELISEPAAAAGDYAAVANVESGALLLVYDLGGGTFDVALLRRAGDRFEHVVEPAGIERLGGIDFDEAVFQHVLDRIPRDVLEAVREHPEGPASLSQLKRRCVEAKEALSSDPASDVPVMLPGHMSTVHISRDQFEAMIRPSIEQTIELVQRTVNRAGIDVADLHAALLVGGSSRIPMVPQLVSRELGALVKVDAHPKLVTARGAARLAATGVGRKRAAATPRRTSPWPPVDIDEVEPRSKMPLLLGAGVLVAAAIVAGALVLSGGDGGDGGAPGTTAGAVVPATSSEATSAPTALVSPDTEPTSSPTGGSVVVPPTGVPTTAAPFSAYAVTGNIATLAGPVDLEVVGDDLWVMSQEAGTLQRFDLTSLNPTAVDTVPLGFNQGRNGNDVIPVDGALFVTQQDAGTVARVDLATLGVPPERIAIPLVDDATSARPLNGALLGDTVWVTVISVLPNGAETGSLVPLDAATGAVGTPIPMAQKPYGIVAVDDALWVTFDDVDLIGRVDVTTGEVETVDGFDHPIDILPIADELWVVTADADRLAVVAPDRMRVQRYIDVGFRPWKMAAGMGSVWVTNTGNGGAPGSISRIDATTNDARPLQDPLEVGTAPIEIAVGGDRVYVANLNSASVSVLTPVP